MNARWRSRYVVFALVVGQVSCTSSQWRDRLAFRHSDRSPRTELNTAETQNDAAEFADAGFGLSDGEIASDKSRIEESNAVDSEVQLTAYVQPDSNLNPADIVPDPVTLPKQPTSAVLSTDTEVEVPSTSLAMEPVAPTESDGSLPINLASALRLANARPLVIAAAQSSAWVAEARLQRAKLLWIPEFNLGTVYYRHDGYGPDFNRGQNFPAYGAGSVPGGPLNNNLNYFYAYGSFYQTVNLSDAIFQPLVARQALDGQRHDIQTAKNDAVLAAATAYFDVHQHRGEYTATLEVIKRAEILVDRIEQLSRDLVPRIEVDRMKRTLADLTQKAALSRERWRVASANLTQTLRLDPSAVIVPLEQDHLQITLIDPARPIDELITIALCHRPEISARRADIRAAEARVRLEKARPLLPMVLLTGFQTNGGMRSQFGLFGQGADSSINNWGLREDVSLQLIWQLEGMGLGNLARIREERGSQSESIVRLFHFQDTVAAEVTESQAKVQSAAARVVEAEQTLREAIVTFDGNFDGLSQTTRFNDVLYQVYRPQEVVKAIEQLMNSYDQYYGSIADYNRAQFEMFHALGYPAAEIALTQPPGEAIDVDLQRPFNLPPVIDGPPAANR